MTTTAEVEDAARSATDAKAAASQAEADILAGNRSVTAAALHKLTDTWRHAHLTAQAARSRAEEEGREARLKALEAVGARVDSMADNPSPEGIEEALQAIAEACDRVRAIAAAHDADVSELIHAAVTLGAEPPAPAGPRKSSAFVALKGRDSIVHKRAVLHKIGGRIDAAIRYAVGGNLDAAIAEVPVTSSNPEPQRPSHILRSPANGLYFTVQGGLDKFQIQKIRSGQLTELTRHQVDQYMAGELG